MNCKFIIFVNKKQIMNKILLSLILFLFAVNGIAQDHNRTDDKGRRQGLWMDFYPNGQKRYEGTFKNDKCQGEFKYYDEQGRLKATNTFDKSGEKALNKTYDTNGTMVATGYYLNQKKDGEWRYFSKENGKMILVEDNKDGKVNGRSLVYYETGTLMMERQFVDGLQEGHTKIYYPFLKVFSPFVRLEHFFVKSCTQITDILWCHIQYFCNFRRSEPCFYEYA